MEKIHTPHLMPTLSALRFHCGKPAAPWSLLSKHLSGPDLEAHQSIKDKLRRGFYLDEDVQPDVLPELTVPESGTHGR